MTTSNPEIVSVKDLEKRFGDFTAVDRVSFSIDRGEIFGFLGPNGAGKSTTIRMLCGIITPSSGSGQVAGYDVVRQSESIKQTIGYMSQKFSLYEDLTPVENIRFYLGIYSVPEKPVGRAHRLGPRPGPPGGGEGPAHPRASARVASAPGARLRASSPAGDPFSGRAHLRRRPHHAEALLGIHRQAGQRMGSPSLSRRITWTRR